MIGKLFLLLFCLTVFSCSSLLKYEKNKAVFKNEEFEQKVKIIEVEDAKEDTAKVKTLPEPEITNTPPAPASKPVVKKSKKLKRLLML